MRAVSWDVDGTLYSTSRLAARLWLATVTAPFRGTARESWKSAAAMRRFRKRMASARARGGALVVDAARIERRLARERRWVAPAIAAVGTRPEVVSALRWFGSRLQAQIALSDFECGYKLASLGLTQYFDAVYSGERLGHLKPSPKPFERVLQDLGLPPQCLLHIGDRPETDGAGAQAAGCQHLILGRDFQTFAELQARLAARAPIAVGDRRTRIARSHFASRRIKGLLTSRWRRGPLRDTPRDEDKAAGT